MKKLALAALFAAAPLGAQVPQTSPIATGTLVVRGRCVDFDTGAPLARCRVALTGHQSTGYPLAWGRADWADPPELTTGDAGTFRFELRLSAADEAVDRGRYHLNISHAHHAAWFSHCAIVVACAQGGVDYGDVRLPNGVRPRIRCEDANGAPQPGVILYLRERSGLAANPQWRQVSSDGPQWWVSSSAYARTDIDGYLHLDDPLPPADYTLEVRERDAHRLPDVVTLPAAQAIVAVVVPLAGESAITGRLVDESGQPVEGALLSDGDDGPVSCVTRSDGAFTLVRTKDTGRATASLRLAQNRRYDGWVSVGDIAWGQRDVTLEVPAKTLHTFAVRTPDGTPVEGFNLYCMNRDGGRLGGVRPGRPGGVRLAGSFAGGRATCRLSAGAYELLVVPRSDLLLPGARQAITIEPDRPEIVVEVPRAIASVVEVLFAADRTAAAGVLVEAIEGGEPAPFEWVYPATAVDDRRRRAEKLLVASAPTDERGRAKLQLREAGQLHLRVSGPGVRTCVHTVDFANGACKPILVEAGATMLGSVGPVETLRALDPGRMPGESQSIYSYLHAPTVTIVYDGGKERREGIRLDATGGFRCDGLPPGPVEVQLRRWEKEARNSHRLVDQPIRLGSFTLRAGAPEPVTLRVPAGAGDGR